jgi:hypothetical protein
MTETVFIKNVGGGTFVDASDQRPGTSAAQALRAIPSEKRAQASRENGKKGGRKRRCHECKDEIKPGDSWERHSYGKGRYLYCSNCAERIRREQMETDRMEDRRYP